MANQIIVDYIKSVKAQGYEDNAIVEALHKNGWKDEDINGAYESFLITQTPRPVDVSINNVNPTKTVEQVSFTANTTVLQAQKITNYESPFSTGVAIALFASLFILANKIISDITPVSATINNKLFLDAIIIMPFLFFSFVTYSIASVDRQRFIIVAKLYFLVSSLLFLRLLWNVSLYLLKEEATYGVYVVLIIALLVLTSFVFLYKNFLKS